MLSSASASIEKSSLIWAVFSTIFSTINDGGGAEEGRGISLCNLHQFFNFGIDPLVATSIYINRVINYPSKATNATAMENIRPIWKNIPFLLSRSAFSDFLSPITYIIMPAILIFLIRSCLVTTIPLPISTFCYFVVVVPISTKSTSAHSRADVDSKN